MKKIAAISLVLVIILALVGCDVATRNYRRYNTTAYDTSLGSANNGRYRAGTGQRMYNAADGAIITRRPVNRTTTATDGTGASPLNPDLNPQYKTFNENALRGGMFPASPGGAATNRNITGNTTRNNTIASPAPDLKINKAR